MKKLFLLLTISFIIQSCNKEKEETKPKEWNISLFQTDFDYQRISSTDHYIYCYGIKLNPNNSGIIYTLIKTNRSSLSWEKVNFEPKNIYEMGGWKEMCFFNDTLGMMTRYRALFKTSNGGKTWDTTFLGSDNFSDIYVQGDIVFGYNSGQFRYSKNYGKDWIKFMEPQYVSSLCFVNEKEGFASSSTGFYETTNGGDTWNLKSTPEKEFLRMHFVNDKKGIATSIFLDSPHSYPKTLINITNDGGITWKTIKLDSVSNAQLEPQTSVLYKSVDKIYVGCVNGIFLSQDNGLSWKQDYVDTLYNGGIWIRDLKLVDDKIYAVGWGGLLLTK